MKTNFLFPALLLVVGFSGSVALADEVVKPTPFPASSASPDQASVEEPVVIDHVVYLAKLPSPEELVKGAELKATPIVRMDQTADRIVVVYQYGGGRQSTFAYVLLSKVGSTTAPAAPVSSATYSVVTPTTPPPVTTTVVYSEPREVYYAPRVRYYDPAWDFWTPLAVGIGLGWGFGGHSHGGWHGGHGWHH